jgi:hypothetical protein
MIVLSFLGAWEKEKLVIDTKKQQTVRMNSPFFFSMDEESLIGFVIINRMIPFIYLKAIFAHQVL